MKMATDAIILVCTVLHITTASMVNVALGKPASMNSNKSGFNASTAVDGNTAAIYTADQIIDTDENYIMAWWKVDLEREVQDATVRIYFRIDDKERRNGVELYTSTSPFPNQLSSQGRLCHTVTGRGDGSDIPDVYNVTCPGRWRYLLLHTDTDNDGKGPVLEFGEIAVIVCSEGTYGEDCTKICSSRNCVTMTTTCERDGRCPDGCQSGRTGLDCTQECESGTYGDGCSLSCTDRNCLVLSAECNHVTGQCGGVCQAGYQAGDCKQACDLGVNYGVNCNMSCTDRHCNHSSECDTETAQCTDGCQKGWTGVDCTSQCPDGTFGSDCTSCTTRHCLGESDCPADGTCSQGCQDGWTGITCSEECSRGMYGPGCSKTCGNCSSDYSCHHVTGKCPSGCKAGWRTEKCNEVCSDDTYGPDCTEKCGKCDGVCDSVDGRCPAGCLDGYCGGKCDLALSGEELACFDVAYLAGAVVGTFLVVGLLAVGIHIYLIRQGRLQWSKTSEARQSVEDTRDSTQMSNIAPRPAENNPPGNQVHNNDYAAAVESGQMQGNKDYEFIQQKHYENL